MAVRQEYGASSDFKETFFWLEYPTAEVWYGRSIFAGSESLENFEEVG